MCSVAVLQRCSRLLYQASNPWQLISIKNSTTEQWLALSEKYPESIFLINNQQSLWKINNSKKQTHEAKRPSFLFLPFHLFFSFQRDVTHKKLSYCFEFVAKVKAFFKKGACCCCCYSSPVYLIFHSQKFSFSLLNSTQSHLLLSLPLYLTPSLLWGWETPTRAHTPTHVHTPTLIVSLSYTLTHNCTHLQSHSHTHTYSHSSPPTDFIYQINAMVFSTFIPTFSFPFIAFGFFKKKISTSHALHFYLHLSDLFFSSLPFLAKEEWMKT